jgi:transmembrane sensor
VSDDVKQSAAEWLVRLQSGSMPLAEREQFVDWLRASPAHVAEMLHLSRMHAGLSEFSQWAEIAPESAVDPPIESGSVIAFPGVNLRRSAPRRWLGAAVAAAIVIVVACGVLVTGYFGQTAVETRVGERHEMTLADGTEVSIAPNSRVRINLDSKQRLVVLDSGEAFFHVSKDPRRPFVVDAGQMRALAVGTSFNVERLTDTVVVTVVEGRVDVGSAGSDRIPVIANEQVSVSRTGRAAAPRRVNGTRETAWLHGQLVFENDPVDEVVRRFNSYNQMQVYVMSDSLGSRPVSGVFRATDPESFIAFLQSVAGARVKRTDHNTILLFLDPP